MQMPPCAVIVNPHAGRGRTRRMVAELSRAAPGQVVVTDSPAALRAAAQRLAGQGARLVAACGGDGTTMSVLSELVRAYGDRPLPALLLLRSGTVNTVARNLGLRGRPGAVLARVLAQLDRGERPATRPWDTVLVREGPAAAAEARCGFLFAAAMGARFLETYYGRPAAGPLASLGQLLSGPRGDLLWAGALALRTAGSCAWGGPLAQRLFAETPAELEVDGVALQERRFRHIVAATVADVGLGMRVAWRAGGAKGRFHLVASALPLWSMALQLPRVLWGAPLSPCPGGPHTDVLARRAVLRFSQEQPYTLDGDLFRAAEIEISAGPQVDLVVY